ncbi:MAG: S4 domain-containing protein [Myxococcota bacterium]
MALAAPASLLDAGQAGAVKSRGEARRLVAQGGISVDGVRADDPELVLAPSGDGAVVRIGKKRAYRFVLGGAA